MIEEEENKEKLKNDKNQDYSDDDDYYSNKKQNKNNAKNNKNNNYNINLDCNSQINFQSEFNHNNNTLNKNSSLYAEVYQNPSTNDSKKTQQAEKHRKKKQRVSNLAEILKLPDEKFYDHLNFRESVKNWNDFSQAKFTTNSFNDIKMLDVDINCRGSYLKGFEFFENDNFTHSYLERFEDNFRKFLEDCDRLELLNLNCDFNSFWGGLSNRLIESFDDETPKITKVIFGSDVHSSFMRKRSENASDKNRDFKIDLNSVLDFNKPESDDFNKNNNGESFEQDLEKLVNYLWYFTDLEANKRNVLFHPILRGMNPKATKELFGYKSDKYYAEDPVYSFYSSAVCGANLQNLLVPLRSRFCGNANYLNNISCGSNSLNFFESTINLSLENPVKLAFPKLFGNKQFNNNGVIYSVCRNTNTVYWPVFYENLEKNKKRNCTVIHGFKEDYRFIDEKIENFFRKTADFNYTCLEGFNMPFCFPRKFQFKKSYSFNDTPEEDTNRGKLDKNEMLNEAQKKMLEKKINFNVPENEIKEVFLNKLNISSTYSNFNNDYTKKFIHVVPKLMKKHDQKIKQYLNNFDMGKFIEYREKLEDYHEFLDHYKQNDFYGGLGIGDSDEEKENGNQLNDEKDDYDY